MCLYWINITKTRYNREPYYLSLNIGLSTSAWGRYIIKSLLDSYETLPMNQIRPNIIFNVKAKNNADPASPNYDLYLRALHCSAKKMIPTYLLMDSIVNRDCEPDKLGIMGCRTRVYQNSYGEEGVIGRGNIAYVSINLPRLALCNSDTKKFMCELVNIANKCKEILLARKEYLTQNGFCDDVF